MLIYNYNKKLHRKVDKDKRISKILELKKNC